MSRSTPPSVSKLPPSPSPWGLKWRSHTLFIITTVGVGVLSDLVLYGILVPVLPFMLRDRLQVPEDEIQFRVDELLALYAGGSLVLSPIVGFFADQMPNRQLPFLAGLSALFAATLLLYVAKSLPLLYIARLLQGVSAAVVWPVGMALTLDTVGAKNLGKTIGSMFTFVTVFSIFSPTIGGLLYARTGLTGVFAVSGGVLIFDFLMRLVLIEKKTAAKYQCEGSVAASIPETDGGNDSAEPSEESPLLNSEDLFLYKIHPEQPAYIQKYPFLYCLRDSSLLASMLIALIQALLIGSFDATVPKFSEELFGFNSLDAGLLFICMGIADAVSGPIIGILIDKYGTRIISVIAYTYLVPVLISLRTVTENSKEQLILYCCLLALNGLGLGLVGAPAIVEAGAVVQRYYEANPKFFREIPPYAQLYGLNSTVFMGGLTLGPLLAGYLKDTIGYGNMNAVIAVISAVTAVLCFMFLGKRPPRPTWLEDESRDWHAQGYGSTA